MIGHRGASGYRPEHTLEAYQLAIDMGADFIEPDLVSTRDGVLVARHESEISRTTDVARRPEFAHLHTTKVIAGATVSGWFTEDFTLAELRTLRAVERLPQLRPANTAFDGLFQVPTLAEIVDLAQRRGVGIYPETKHPTYFAGIGLPLEEPLVATLEASGLRHRTSPVFIQSFEPSSLRKLAEMTDVRLVQLLSVTGRPHGSESTGDRRSYAEMAAPLGLREIAGYADGIGPAKELIVPRGEDGGPMTPTSLVLDAHGAGLVVHPYTFRRENGFLPLHLSAGNPTAPMYAQATGDLLAELRLFLELGVDGVFTDNPDVAVATRTRMLASRPLNGCARAG
ncbi:MAG: Glycerophosphoryl diester phosphodiesterase [uncultured Acidimicrobiales bacterium]|uniref:glycerophosphodiester phosphodiesterase n=1 Tax=uncultured Acidimicrobiales bacterium TaxID=310071 RepID=A0A6J4HTW4_9ACTN|nr:MAG: Glycerophosphoryl diester phosphodiesterase [uncultured Acidimicrobiales bacterium]